MVLITIRASRIRLTKEAQPPKSGVNDGDEVLYIYIYIYWRPPRISGREDENAEFVQRLFRGSSGALLLANLGSVNRTQSNYSG